MIETLRRRGYRFNGEIRRDTLPSSNGNGHAGLEAVEQPRVELVTTESGSHYLVRDEQPEVPHVEVGPTSGRTSLFVGLAAIALVAVGVSIYLLAGPLGWTASNAAKRKIAVLPLKPIDSANRDNLYENGIADALINRLSSIQGFEVRPLSSTRGYDSVTQDPLAAGREQNVDFVVAPNYQVANGRVRITSQLINVATGDVDETYTFENEASS
jgi:TolB-like protein